MPEFALSGNWYAWSVPSALDESGGFVAALVIGLAYSIGLQGVVYAFRVDNFPFKSTLPDSVRDSGHTPEYEIATLRCPVMCCTCMAYLVCPMCV